MTKRPSQLLLQGDEADALLLLLLLRVLLHLHLRRVVEPVGFVPNVAVAVAALLLFLYGIVGNAASAAWL
jgi:hypothetical protein